MAHALVWALLAVVLAPAAAALLPGTLVAQLSFEPGSDILAPSVGSFNARLHVPSAGLANVSHPVTNGSMGITRVAGPPGHGMALGLDGSACIRIDNFPPVASAYNYTVAAWVRFDSPCIGAWCTVIGMWEAGAYLMHVGSNKADDPRISINGSSSHVSLGDWPGLPSAGIPDGGLRNDTWYWIASVRQVDPAFPTNAYTRIEFYINGVLVSSGNETTSATHGPMLPAYPRLDHLYFGCKFVDTSTLYNAVKGAIDELQMYEAALSPEHITSIFSCNDPLCAACSPSSCTACRPSAALDSATGRCVCAPDFESDPTGLCVARPPSPPPPSPPPSPPPPATPAPSATPSPPAALRSPAPADHTLVIATAIGGGAFVLLAAAAAFLVLRARSTRSAVAPALLDTHSGGSSASDNGSGLFDDK